MRPRFVFVSILSLILAQLAPGQTSQPTTVPADAGTPKGALKSLAISLDAGDAGAIRGLLNATTPTEERLIGVMSDMAVTVSHLNKAMIDKFGRQQAVAALHQDPSEMLQQSLTTIDSASEKIDGDSAVVSIGPTPEGALSLKKVGGVWKISVTEQAKGLSASQLDQNVAMVTTQIKTMRDVTTDISAGKYQTALEAASALRGRMGGPPPPATGGAANQSAK